MYRGNCSVFYAIVSCLAYFFTNGSAQAFQVLPSGGMPQWIWCKGLSTAEIDGRTKRVSFHHEFESDEIPRIAKLKIVADFCYLSVWIDQKHVISIEPFSSVVDTDVTPYVRLGKNSIRIDAYAIDGPRAFAAQLILGKGNSVPKTKVVTDNTWTVTDASDSVRSNHLETLGVADASVFGIRTRSIDVEPTENYEQWRKATLGTKVDNEQFWVVPGFNIQHVINASEDEGSWVSMAFDPYNALTISKESKGLLRMKLDANGTSIESAELINDDLLECRGLVYAHQSLYANANNSKGLFRLQNAKAKNVQDLFGLSETTKLRDFPGGVGHGRNDLAIGNDGWIYLIHGDSVDIPKNHVQSRMSPFWNLGQHGTAGNGYLLRTDANGDVWELICAGMRNPYGIAQNEHGDWFTYDADAEFDMGTPWYRPTRILHLVSGSDFGWRAVTGKWPPYFPDHADNAMPVLDVGKGSPTAVMFAYPSKWPEYYRRALLILDWTYGRIIAVHLQPRGSGYRACAETFLQGRPLNVTDIAFHSDGAMYFITGGRKTQSALYRVTFNGIHSQGIALTRHESECAFHAEKMRSLRKRLEEGHSNPKAFNTELVWDHLDSHDWQLRYAARTALEHQPLQAWSQRALAEHRPRALVEASMALIRSQRQELGNHALKRLLSIKTESIDLASQMGLVRCFELLDNVSPDLLRSETVRVSEILSQIIQSNSKIYAVNRCGSSRSIQGDCIRLLERLQSSNSVNLAFETLMNESQQEWKLYGLFSIRNAVDGWDLQKRRDYFRMLELGSHFLRGEGMEKFLKQIREDAVASLTDHERESLSDILENPQSTQSSLEVVPARSPLQVWQLHDLERSIRESDHQPNNERGKKIFAEAQCNRCHRMGKLGPAIGPDLTHVANRFSKGDVLASTVEPSRVIAENYRNAQVITKDGTTLVGRLLREGDYRSEKISLATDPYKMSGNVEIAKSDIEQFRESEISPMPRGLLDGFTVDEIQDLLEYLANPFFEEK